MILIAGSSGSGKTTATKELEKMGYTIVPTYTTRKPRPNDSGTLCISETQFEYMLTHDKFMSYHIFDSKMGPVAYGIPIEEYEQSSDRSIIVLAKEYYEDICHYVKNYTEDDIFLVYIDVDDKSIISRSMNDTGRGLSNTDLIDRLERDREKNQSLKNQSSLIVANLEYGMTPSEIANIISGEYKKIKEGD